MMNMTTISIESEYITLGQFLKLADLISSGGQAKFFLKENDVFVNGKITEQRGMKLYHNDSVNIDDKIFRILCI